MDIYLDFSEKGLHSLPSNSTFQYIPKDPQKASGSSLFWTYTPEQTEGQNSAVQVQL